MWKVKTSASAPVTFPKEMKYRPILENLIPPDPMGRFHLKRGFPQEEFPDLCRNFTWMGRILTLDLYCRQFNRCTQSGVIFDDVIRPGLEEPGDCLGPVSVGCVAGDAESYILFCDFFDRVIEAYHEQRITSQTPESDLNYDNLKGGDDLDRSYAVRCEVSVVRGIEDFCFPTHCSRGERRRLLTLARQALKQLEQELAGRLLLLKDLSQKQQSQLNLKAPTSSQLRIGVARDWPDARAVWVSEDESLLVWVNIDEHLRLVSMREDANVAEAFQCICINLQKVMGTDCHLRFYAPNDSLESLLFLELLGVVLECSPPSIFIVPMGNFKTHLDNNIQLEKYYRGLRHPFIWKQQLGWVMSSPADVGTGLRITVLIKLQHLPKHKHLKDVLKRLRINMDKTESPALYNISNMATFGLTEVGLTQLVVDGVKLLIIMEKRLEGNLSIDELVPAQK